MICAKNQIDNRKFTGSKNHFPRTSFESALKSYAARLKRIVSIQSFARNSWQSEMASVDLRGSSKTHG
jgi:hypothetical protein